MHPPDRGGRRKEEAAPALFRLLSESAASRAALAACGFEVAIADARAQGHPLIYANPAFESAFGYRRDEVVGRPAITLLFPEDESAADMFRDASARVEMRIRRKEGSAARVELSIGMLNGADGTLTHRVLGFADRSELARLREELRLVRSLAAAP